MKKKILSLLLAVLMLLPLYACGGNNPPESSTTEEITTEYIAPAEPYDYTDPRIILIRPDDISDGTLEAVKKLKTGIESAFGIVLEITVDWLAPGKEANEYEILVGNTNRPETEAVKLEIGTGAYAIKMVGKKLVIYGSSDDLTAQAIDYFLANIVPAGKVIDGDFSYLHKEKLDITSLKVLGADISDCAYVMKDPVLQYGADYLVSVIGEKAGFSIPAQKSTGTAKVKFVFQHQYEKKLSSDDYAITVEDNTITISATGKYGSLAAAKYLADSYLNAGGEVNIAPEKGLLKEFIITREEYLANPELLPIHWADKWSPEAHMIDYQEKIDCLTQKNRTHVFTVSHRGDFLFYPENSLESYISVWLMGGDCIETDIHYTLDGVPIIMHDATLSRMTDAADYVGKPGYPENYNVAEWTMDQIKVLRLKAGQGGSSAGMTNYPVATLEEVLKVAKNRFFLIVDKQTEWRYVDIEGLQPKSAANFLYPLMKKTGNFESVLISYGTIDTSADGTLDANEALQIQKYVYEHDGVKMYTFLRCWTTRNTFESYTKTLTAGSLSNAGVLVNGAFDPKNSTVIKDVQKVRKAYPNALIGGWTIDSNGFDKAETWDVMYKAGYRSIMTNNMFGLVQWAATKK